MGQAGLYADVDPAQLETALLNLAVNARDAMPKGGELTIRADLSPPPIRDGHTDAAAKDGWIRIEVSDSGHGMPPETLAKVFEPFFTTKEVGKGSGLGLSQVYGFVQQSGGHITAENLPEAGACFRLFLPRSETAPVQAPVAAPVTTAEGHGRLLVVEDDAQVLAVTVEMLSGLGYEVTTACDAASALELLKADAPVDLLFSDVIMPGGRNGLELAHIAREMRPGLKVLLSSGYVGQGVSLTDSAFEVIDKPYERSALAAKLSALLCADDHAAKDDRPRTPSRRRKAPAASPVA
jgi:CheY-like chemotaxis protein